MSRPVIAVLGGISATRHVTSSPDGARGWWDAIAGDGAAIDTGAFDVVGLDYVTKGKSGAPVTTEDQADALREVVRARGGTKLSAIIGASYGGMVALAFGAKYPSLVEKLIVISAAHRSDPMATALRSLQRRVIALGVQTGRAHHAVAIARGIAMTTYRTADEFADRFTVEAPANDELGNPSFPVEDYLHHKGIEFAARYSAARYLALSLSLDLHCVDPRRVTVPATLVAVRGDSVVPLRQMIELSATLGAPSTLIEIDSRYGHDAFLKETETISTIIRSALEGADALTLAAT